MVSLNIIQYREDFLPIVVITSPMKVGVSLNIVIIVVLIKDEVFVEVNLIVVVFNVEWNNEDENTSDVVGKNVLWVPKKQ